MSLRKTSSKPLKEKSKALSYAYWLLSRQALSSKDLRARLKRRECPEQIAEPIIEQMIESGYVDDESYLRSLMKIELSRGHGRRWIAAKLMSKGWRPEEFDEVMEEIVTQEAEIEAAQKLLNGRLKEKEPQKARAALYRRGFVHISS